MVMTDYDQLIREYFDLSDVATRQMIVSVNEDNQQTQLLNALSSALYDKIVAKVDKIDFGTIPRSRGDITKIEGFEQTMECLNIMRRLVMEYRQNPAAVDTIITAIENIKVRKPIFMKGYALNVEFPMVMYNLIVAAIEQSLSFMIAVCIQFIKDPASNTMEMALDTVAYANSKDNMLFEQLVTFNEGCANKDIDGILEGIIKNGGRIKEECDAMGVEYPDSTPFNQEVEPTAALDKEPDPNEQRIPVNGSADENQPIDIAQEPVPYEQNTQPVPVQEGLGVAAAIAGVGALTIKLLISLVKVIIPALRNITYIRYNTKISIADALSVQAQLIEANAYKLQYSTTSELSDDKRKKVVEKQLKVAERLKKWANKFAIDGKQAAKAAKKDAEEDERQRKKGDIYVPTDSDGSLF